MLRISKKLDYSLTILVHLAGAGDGARVSARDVSQTYRLPLPITAAILKLLARKGLIRSSRGARGGYSLATAPRRLTLDRIIAAVDGPLKLTDCALGSARSSRCRLAGHCLVSPVMRRLQAMMVRTVSAIDLRHLAGAEPL